jgi:hypothetical protein
MSDAMPPTVYSIDTNVLMDWQVRYFPTDVFASLITKIDGLISVSRFLAPALVREELENTALSTADLILWSKQRSQVLVPLEEVLQEGLSIMGRFPGLNDPKSEYDEADAYVIALARLRNGIVVTQETPAAEKRNPKRTHFIPDVCRELGVPCINLLGMMRREGWVF